MRKLGTTIAGFLVGLGGWGLFGLALLNDAFLPLPGGPDALLLGLCILTPARAPLYVAAAILGSVCGCGLLLAISRRGGKALREAAAQRGKMERAMRLLRRNDLLALAAATLMPPPFPFKLFLIASGASGVTFQRSLVGIALGRLVRFGLLGTLAALYGRSALGWMRSHYPAVSLVLVALLIAWIWLRQRRTGSPDA
jgi:membrane protein YqaA with SNARE-associated domain